MPKNIGEKIKTFRIERGLTQEMLSKILRIPRTGLAQIEAGKQEVYARQLKYLALAFRVSVDNFIRD